MNFEQAFKKLVAPVSSGLANAASPAIFEVKQGSSGPETRQVTYRDFEELICHAREALFNQGVGPGERILIWAPNGANLAAVIFAAWSLGAISIPVDARLTSLEINNVKAQLGAKLVLDSEAIDSLFSDKETKAKSDNPRPQSQTSKPPSIDEVLKLHQEKKPAFVILTSGTTGLPKGASHDLPSLCQNVDELGNMLSMHGGTKILLPLPISHIFGLEVLIACILFGGAVILPDASPKTLVQAIMGLKPSIISGVPTIYGALVGSPVPDDLFASAEIILSGGAPLPEALAESFKQKFGKILNQGYGSTETKIMSVNVTGPVLSVGKVIPSVTVEIVDEEGNVLPEGQTGEIRISGPSLMQCYLAQDELTKKALKDGQYLTGDIGNFENGYLFISGRSKEMIIVAGNKIFPNEVESVLLNNPNTKEVAVIGQEHAKLGQTVKAVVVLRDPKWDEELDGSPEAQRKAKDELVALYRQFCQENLKRELRPMSWDFRASTKPLPKTRIGKIDKKVLT